MEHITRRSPYSRWASEAEIKSSLYAIDLNDNNPHYGGIPLFADSGSVYVDRADTHSLIIGSTGSKKTRLIGMPTLRLYTQSGESFVATDPKAELYERTLPLLKRHGYRVFILNLRNPSHSNGWNPLAMPYRLYWTGQKDKAIELITDMANCMVKEDAVRDPFWQNSAADLLAGLMLTLFECAQEDEINFKSLRALRTQAFKCHGSGDTPYIWDRFLKRLDGVSFITSLLSGTAEVCRETRSCIISEFDQAMRPFFSQDNLIDMLSGSDLDMGEMGKRKTAVFLIIPDENTLYHRLVSVFVKQCYTELILAAQKHPSKKLPRRVNFLLDEFATLPAISDFPAMITASRSRNIRFNLIVQGMSQLRRRYGEGAETIRGNCENWVFLHSRELSLLNELIDMCGNKSTEEPLISTSLLQTLDKDKGEAFILHKRLYPFITRLPDIDHYPGIMQGGRRVQYPLNAWKAQSVFDFQRLCDKYEDDFFASLFNNSLAFAH